MRKESSDPKLRAMMETFIDPITQTNIDQALSQTLITNPVHESYDEFTQNLIDQVLIPGRKSDSYSITALARELLQLNHPSIWELFFAQSPGKHQELERKLLEDLHRFPDNSPGLKIAVTNLSFFGHTLVNYAAAVSYGKEYEAHIIPFSQISPNNDLESPRYTAGSFAARHFKTAARTPQEILHRLQILFPPNTSTPNDIPAFQFAHQANAFRESFPDRIGSCIGVGIAQMLFSSYGRLLATPDYQSILLQNIARPRAGK